MASLNNSGMLNQKKDPFSDPNTLGLLGTGLSLLESSGPSLNPSSAGQLLGRAGMAGLQMRNQAAENQFNQQYKEAQMAQMMNKDSGYFDGNSIEGQSLNRYLMSLPPDQRDAAANELARQRLQRQTTLATPEGTMMLPGYNLAQPAVTPPQGTVIPKPTTDQERLASGYAERMGAAENIFTDLSGKGFNPANMADTAGSILPGIAGSAATSPEYKSYKAAAEDWITANLRKESGATITPQEFDRDFKKYFPQPFDTPEVQKQKADARKLAQENVRFSAGKAADQRSKPETNSGPKIGTVEDGYKFKGGDPKDPNNWEPI